MFGELGDRADVAFEGRGRVVTDLEIFSIRCLIALMGETPHPNQNIRTDGTKGGLRLPTTQHIALAKTVFKTAACGLVQRFFHEEEACGLYAG